MSKPILLLVKDKWNSQRFTSFVRTFLLQAFFWKYSITDTIDKLTESLLKKKDPVFFLLLFSLLMSQFLFSIIKNRWFKDPLKKPCTLKLAW